MDGIAVATTLAKRRAVIGADFLESQVLKSPEEVMNFYPEI